MEINEIPNHWTNTEVATAIKIELEREAQLKRIASIKYYISSEPKITEDQFLYSKLVNPTPYEYKTNPILY